MNQWVITTYGMMRNKKLKQWIMHHMFVTVIADEGHYLKRLKSQQTKDTIRGTRQIPNRIEMTATPIGNDPGDIFSQAKFVDDGATFGKDWWDFMNKYYIKPEGSSAWCIKRDSKKKMRQKMTNFSYGYMDEGVLKLPKSRYVTKAVEMTPKQKKMYNDVLTQWEYELDNGEVVELKHVIVQMAKLRQIASGFIYDREGKPQYITCSKLALLKELMTTPEYLMNIPKLVIWCSFTAEILMVAKLMKQLKKKAVLFYGSDDDRNLASRKMFRDKKSVKVFIGQVESGTGINELICSGNAVYFSNSLKVISRTQSEGRTRRKGSEKLFDHVTYWNLLSEDSIDEVILQSINKSISVADYILGEIQKGVRPSRLLKLKRNSKKLEKE